MAKLLTIEDHFGSKNLYNWGRDVGNPFDALWRDTHYFINKGDIAVLLNTEEIALLKLENPQNGKEDLALFVLSLSSLSGLENASWDCYDITNFRLIWQDRQSPGVLIVHTKE